MTKRKLTQDETGRRGIDNDPSRSQLYVVPDPPGEKVCNYLRQSRNPALSAMSLDSEARCLSRLFVWRSRILNSGMRVRVLMFGVLKDVFQRSEDSLELASGSTVSDLLEHYRKLAPDKGKLFHSLALAVNQQYASAADRLRENDEVALLPPVSGGVDVVVRPDSYRCEIVRERIETEQVLARIKQGEDGAVVVFEGIVRNHTRSRQTLFLDYEAYEPMALSQMNALAEKIVAHHKVREVAIVHRLGRLGIGETSVLIVVASAHRAAAFDACRMAIDTLKRTVPIWKKEHFSDGIVWADGEPFPEQLRPSTTPAEERDR